jgi:Sulfotransferase domain
MKRLPDFIVIGAMKSATSTLHEQLNEQYGFFMSEEKEPNFFSNDDVYAKGLDWYASLFAGATFGDFCGESSTHYTKLPTYPHTIARMRAALPQVKLVYMMRHPIDRLISHYMHEQFEWRMQVPIEEAIYKYPELVSYGCYSGQLEPFRSAYGAENILLIFFERFIHSGLEELQRVCQFVGSQRQPRWIEHLEATNVSSHRMRESLVRDAIVNAPVLRAIRKRFVPRSWRDRVKRLWQIKQRPQLSDSTVQYLEEIFDADLSRLGRWLNIELSCRRFHEVAISTVPMWSQTTGAPANRHNVN